jgi:hypothetical protein
MTEDIIPAQVQNILTYIDASQSEAVKASIFQQLGRECFHTRSLAHWLEPYRGNPQAFLERVNSQQDKYWEKLEFSADGKTLLLTGRVVQRCACAFAGGPQPNLSLCNFCCKGFQEEFFRTLLGKKVSVEITESYLLGGERCSNAIHLLE